MNIKHAVTIVLSGLGVAILAGCPIYPDGRDHRVCIGGSCYDCNDPYYSSSCSSWTCGTSYDCPDGYTCNANNRCTPGLGFDAGPSCGGPADCAPGTTCGADNQCHPGDCAASGCSVGFVCKLDAASNGVPACVATGTGTGSGTPSLCKNDAECSNADGGAGAKCLTGRCVAPADQCADATQCANGAQCVDGSCTPSCSASKACPTGYGCDVGKGVCTVNPSACSSSAQCNGNVCVDEHCVAPCGADSSCPSGLVCIDGGCTPDERPVFTCAVDGAQDSCQPGSLCLRHSCYIGCSVDAGADACKNADKFNVCKTVTTSSGTHDVCGSAANLGTECDPTQARNCNAPLICIDGYCR